jgi:tetratricopeptide (TPR) repeat protein
MTEDIRRSGRRTSIPGSIGPWQIHGVLGEGGMGIVYEASESGAVRRRVALKVVRAGSDSREVLARFDVERQALALMSHAGIAKVFSAGETESRQPWFAMELVHGLPLTDYCDSRRLSTRDRLVLFVAVCQAVQHAHQKGVIHRDLKPSNILVTEQDGVQMLVTNVGVVLGTAAYMSPEQAASPGLDVDTRTDVYTLGVILYELLTGQLPLEPNGEGLHVFLARLASRDIDATRPSELLTRLGTGQGVVARDRRTDAAGLVRALRGDLDWIVMKALEPDRGRRYESVAALAADVSLHLADKPVSARPPTASYRLAKFARRHRVAVPATLIALVTILASAAFATAGMVRATRAEAVARREADAAHGVTDFLVDLFRASVPGEVRGDQLTARQLLDRGAQRASLGLADQPALQGRIMQTIGTAYSALGLYDAARPQLERALTLREAVFGPASLEVAESESALGDAAMAHGDLDLAAPHLRRALAIRQASLPPSSPDVAKSLGLLGVLALKQGRLAAADSLCRLALTIDERPGGDSALLARHRMNLGVVKWQEQRFGDAEPLMRGAIAVQERRLGPQHPDLASMWNNLGGLYWSMQRYADALPLYERTRAVFERTLDPNHPNMASILNNLGETYWKLHRYGEAEPLFRRALAIKEAKLTPDNVSLAVTLNGLGGLLHDEGRLVESEAAYRRALAIREKALGPTHPDVVETARALASLLAETGRTQEAETLRLRFALGH